MLAVKWSPLAGATVVKKDVWEKIDPALREKLKKIAAEETEASRAEIRKMGQKAIAAMKDRNLEVVDPGPEVVAKWRAAARKAYPVIEGKVVPEAMFDRVQKLLEDYRAKKGG
jgi:TRAP-type C4-dicarboxylate transport system substrate-binding protein